MITAVDTNVFIGLWNEDDALNMTAANALKLVRGPLAICGAVYAELLAWPGRTEEFLDDFFSRAQINIDWTMDENVWRMAGSAFSEYSARRRKARSEDPRRILADFVIGAHAWVNHYAFLTLDDRLYRAAFPKLQLIRV
jgi:predicted nucleic acid-binding protein